MCAIAYHLVSMREGESEGYCYPYSRLPIPFNRKLLLPPIDKRLLIEK
jgi:hypothetical protein